MSRHWDSDNLDCLAQIERLQHQRTNNGHGAVPRSVRRAKVACLLGDREFVGSEWFCFLKRHQIKLLALLALAFTSALVVGLWQASVKELTLKKHGYPPKSV